MASQPQAAVRPARIGKLNRDLLAQLKEFENTPEEERWPGAKWPKPQAFRDAEAFVRKLPLDSVPMPDMGLADDGEVNFLWKKDGVHVDLGFYGTGAYSYFARSKSGNKIYEEDALVSDDFPGEILALFKI